jgi:hypothetical protein
MVTGRLIEHVPGTADIETVRIELVKTIRIIISARIIFLSFMLPLAAHMCLSSDMYVPMYSLFVRSQKAEGKKSAAKEKRLHQFNAWFSFLQVHSLIVENFQLSM